MHAEAIAILTDLERHIDTSALNYGGVSYWPLCRQKIWGALMQRMVLSAKGGSDKVSNTGPAFEGGGTVNVITVGPPQLGLIHPNEAAASHAIDAGALKPSALFILRPEEYFDTVDGARFAKTVDSVCERAKARYPIAKLELADPRTINFARTIPSLFLQLDKAGQGAKYDPPYKLENFSLVADALRAANCDVTLDTATLTTEMGKVFYFARIFERVLAILAPKALFQSVYYHPVGMGWVLACRRLGITTVDVQHGRLGPHEGHYTQLTAAPPNGYDLVPDMVLCWGRQTKHDIEVDKNLACTRHGGIIGGNAWLARSRYGTPTPSPSLDALCAGRKPILVSLQPLESPIGPELLKAITESPKDWLWLLRLHPLRRHTAPEIKAILTKVGAANIELEQATDAPLFSLLPRTVHHVTAFSSVAIEAAAFDVPTSLTGPEGLQIYGPQLDRGIFRYTPTARDILAHIHDCIARGRVPLDDDFIDMRPDAADHALDAILGAP